MVFQKYAFRNLEIAFWIGRCLFGFGDRVRVSEIAFHFGDRVIRVYEFGDRVSDWEMPFHFGDRFGTRDLQPKKCVFTNRRNSKSDSSRHGGEVVDCYNPQMWTACSEGAIPQCCSCTGYLLIQQITSITGLAVEIALYIGRLYLFK